MTSPETNREHPPSPHSLAAAQGLKLDDANPDLLREGLEEAFSYRGDVTLTLKPDLRRVEGYLYDRRVGADLHASTLRMLLKDSDERLTISYASIASVEFTGKDTAAGKSWENWLKRYAEKKLAGEKANIEAESLE